MSLFNKSGCLEKWMAHENGRILQSIKNNLINYCKLIPYTEFWNLAKYSQLLFNDSHPKKKKYLS